MTSDQLRKLIERKRQLHDQFPLSYEHIQTHKKLEEALRALAPHFLALWEAAKDVVRHPVKEPAIARLDNALRALNEKV